MTFFPFEQYWWIYLFFILFVFLVLAIDLGVFNKKAHDMTFKEAAGWSIAWFVMAVMFAGLFYWYSFDKFTAPEALTAFPGIDGPALAKRLTLEFATGYLVELFLSIDNIFIFIVIFDYFAIGPKHQHRILFYGILGALIFRGLFIALGSVLMSISWVVYFFGGLLIFTGLKMMFAKDDKEMDPEKNFLIRILKRFFPIYPKIEGQDFFKKINGLWHMTPLFVTLVILEMTDIVFAVDSVPAIFAITKEPMVVFTSNIFAILGLRSLYFTLIGIIGRFHLLKYGLGAVLIFVGNKMVWLNNYYGGHFPPAYSLGIITALIALSVIASLYIKPKKKPAK